jgi:hypothetical protein
MKSLLLHAGGGEPITDPGPWGTIRRRTVTGQPGLDARIWISVSSWSIYINMIRYRANRKLDAAANARILDELDICWLRIAHLVASGIRAKDFIPPVAGR